MNSPVVTTTEVVTSPGFNVDADVLARSPTGSITDLSQIQSDTENDTTPAKIDKENGTLEISQTIEDCSTAAVDETDVKVTITSPKGMNLIYAEIIYLLLNYLKYRFVHIVECGTCSRLHFFKRSGLVK